MLAQPLDHRTVGTATVHVGIERDPEREEDYDDDPASDDPQRPDVGQDTHYPLEQTRISMKLQEHFDQVAPQFRWPLAEEIARSEMQEPHAPEHVPIAPCRGQKLLEHRR